MNINQDEIIKEYNTTNQLYKNNELNYTEYIETIKDLETFLKEDSYIYINDETEINTKKRILKMTEDKQYKI